MPRSLAITPVGDRLKLARVKAAAADSPEALQRLTRDEVLQRMRLNELGEEWGVIKFKREWLPPGTGQANPNVDIRKILLNQSDRTPANLDDAVLVLSRLALILFLLPQPSKNTRKLLQPSTVIKKLEAACRLAGRALRHEGEPKRVFSRIKVAPTVSFNTPEKQTISHLVRLGDLGLWSDCPIVEEADGLERRRRGQTKVESTVSKPDPHQPFSDEFVGEGGWRLVWILEQLGPAIIKCAHELAAVRASVPHFGSEYGYDTRVKDVSIKFLTEFEWRTPDGSILSSLTFPVSYQIDGEDAVDQRMTTSLPRRFADMRALLKLLEGAHLFVFLLSCGGRASEMLSLKPGCVTVSGQGEGATIDGRTYKLTQTVGGELRDWPLPEMGVLAIHQQEKLKTAVRALYPDDGSLTQEERPPESIWCRITAGAHSFTTDYNDFLVDTIKMLGLEHLAGGTGLSAHRFRKTTARIIALAVVSAPELLMRLFGHREMQMTLYYILSDPSIRGEIETMMKAQTIMLAENVVRDADRLGGPAAPRVQAAVALAKARHGEDFQSVGIRELAETLTFSGQYWRLVRGHVICTKGPLQESPCKRGSAITDPANCQSKCGNRLEDGFLHDDVDRTLAEAIQQFDDAENRGDDLLAGEWRGQIGANLRRFSDLDEKWGNHPEVSRLLNKASATATSVGANQ